MTLISATLHWKGTCFAADTRGTNEEIGSFKDCYQKFYHVNGGVAMAISGSAYAGIELRKIIQKNMKDLALNGFKLKPLESSEHPFKEIIEKSLDDIQENEFIKQMEPGVISEGLISIQDMGMKLRLDSEECNNLMNILCESEGIELNSYYPKYIEDICNCARGEIGFVEIEDSYQSFLFEYSLIKINNTPNEYFYDVKRIKFGDLRAFGSGSNFDYEDSSSRTLAYVLFSPGAELIDDSALHLARLHEIAQSNVDIDPKFGFKTFGGSIISGYVITNKNGMSATNMVLGTQKRKSDNVVVSNVFEKNGKLFVMTEDGNEEELITFTDIEDSLNLKLKN